MTETTTPEPQLVAVTEAGDDRETWMKARASRVTASQAHAIAVGGRSTWQRILEEKLNGAKFKGTASTRRGNTREAFLLDYARTFIDHRIEPNAVLYSHPEKHRIGATPDGVSFDFGVEVKSLDFGADPTTIPAEHYDQCQIGMYVTDMDRWLYGREIMGEDGEPTLDDPTFQWIKRDERRIEYLVREADKFLAWWDAGAPATDDLPAEMDDALAAWADARARKKDAEADEKAAEKIIRDHIAATPGAEDDGLKLAGRAAQFVYSVTERDDLDTEAWRAAEPESFERWEAVKAAAEGTAVHAAALYRKPKRSTRLNITPTKETA